MLLSSATLGNVKYEMTDIYPTNLPGMDRKPKMCYGYLRDLTHSKFSKEVNVSVDRHHSRKENSYRICTLATRSRAGQSNAAQSQARAADETPVLLISSLYTKRHPMRYPARNVVSCPPFYKRNTDLYEALPPWPPPPLLWSSKSFGLIKSSSSCRNQAA